MGFNVKSLYSNNAGKSNNTTTKQSSFNVRSLNDQVFEIKLNDNKTIGNISYGAKKAIENNTLDSYTPKNEEEKKSLETYKKWTGYGKTYDAVKSQYDKDKYGKGNIDLTNRPVLINEDNTISTVDTITIGVDGKQVVIPTIDYDEKGNAKKLTTKEAEARYYKTGEHLGVFDSVEEADEYAQSLHIDQDLYYAPIRQEKEEKQKMIDSNPVFKRYNIDPDNFNYTELEAWAKNHNHEIYINSTGHVIIEPKKEGGFLGIGGNSTASKQEEEDAKVLVALLGNNAQKNLSQTDLGAIVASGYDFAYSYSL